jgi:protoporphyrinogen oxidase
VTKTIERVAVIGAGPAGLAAAYKLQTSGVPVTLFEASPQVGGMAKSFELWGQIVDLGPHRFFSSDPRVNKFWLESVDNEYVMVNRLTRIYYKGKFYSYPIQASNALRNLGVIEACKCVLSLIKVKFLPKKDDSKFDSWVSNRFGERLFKIFFKSYTEKLWGIQTSELDAEFAVQRIKKLSLVEAIIGSLSTKRRKKHRTLVDEFAYPVLGAGHVYNKLAAKFISAGGELHLNAPVVEIKIGMNSVYIEAQSGLNGDFKHVISTMPLNTLISKIEAPIDIKEKSNLLKFRNTILVYLKVKGKNPFPDQWIYVHAQDLLTGRITNFKNWTKTINQGQVENIICLEYWCYDSDDIWIQKDSEIINLATAELYATNLVSTGSICEGYVRRVAKCYPVYNSGYKDLLEPIQNYLRKIDRIIPIGRYGSFKYNNQDHSILMGLVAAENLLTGESTDLWAINTDYEYQESARITSTGLVHE